MSSDRLYAPCIYLYAFQLADRSQNPEDHIIYQQCDRLLQQFKSPSNVTNHPETFQANSGNTLHFSYEMAAQNSDRRFSSKIKVNQQDYPVWGSANTRQIYDSYSLWFNLHIPERASGSGKVLEVPIKVLQNLNQNDRLIIDPSNEQIFGQTLVLTILLTDEQKLQGKGIGIRKPERNHLKSLSHNCINALFTDSDLKPEFNRDGELFNSPIFEYSLASDLSSDLHVLIWFVPDKQTEQTYSRCQNKLVDLFFYRHKIIAAYQQSQSNQEAIAENNLKIRKQIDLFHLLATNNSLSAKSLEEVETLLISLSKLALDSSQAIGELETSHNAIAIHIHNYNETVIKIKSIFPSDRYSREFLSYFGQINAPIFAREIQVKLNSFKLDFFVVEQAISSIKTLVELQQIKLSLHLEYKNIEYKIIENKLQALVVGLGTGIIVAETSRYIIGSENSLKIPLINLPVRPFLTSFTLSILMGIFSFIAVDKYLNKQNNKN